MPSRLIPPYRLHQPCIHSGHCSERISLRFSQELPEKLNGKDHNIQWSDTENFPVQQYCLEEPQRQEMGTLIQKLLCEDKGDVYGKETMIHALLTCFKKLQSAVQRIQRRSRRLPVPVPVAEKTPERRKTSEGRNPAPHSRRRKRLLRLQQLLPPIPHHVRLRPERILQKILIFFVLTKRRNTLMIKTA